MMSYDVWKTGEPDPWRYMAVRDETCECECGHEGECEDGCLPADDDTPPELGRWICVGGTRYRLMDTREE